LSISVLKNRSGHRGICGYRSIDEKFSEDTNFATSVSRHESGYCAEQSERKRAFAAPRRPKYSHRLANTQTE
jgi:hypothetical protein